MEITLPKYEPRPTARRKSIIFSGPTQGLNQARVLVDSSPNSMVGSGLNCFFADFDDIIKTAPAPNPLIGSPAFDSGHLVSCYIAASVARFAAPRV